MMRPEPSAEEHEQTEPTASTQDEMSVTAQQPEFVTEEVPASSVSVQTHVEVPLPADEAAVMGEPLSESEESPDAEQPAAEPTAPAPSEPTLPGPALAQVDAPAEEKPSMPLPPFRRGEVVDGTILKTTPTSITVDLGDGYQGLIPGRELENMSRQAIEQLREGEAVKVFVVNPNDHRGNIVLSVNRAMEELDWKMAADFQASQEVYEGNVAGYNKGGLIVRFGRLRGFVPQSQISDDRRRAMEGETPEQRYSRMVNDMITVKVMEVDRSRNRLILSERAAAREKREKRKDTLINQLVVGQVIEGRVVSLEDFGAFVDVGGAEGLVHLTEISWKHVNHPREALEVGQTVRVEVISVDRERKRIGLSIKRQEADPWDEVATAYDQGELVQAVVTKLTKFGAFARLVDAPDIEGLIHISELSDQRVSHPREVVQEGEKLTLRVVKVDVKNRRLGLSLKRVNSAEFLDHDLQAASQTNGE